MGKEIFQIQRAFITSAKNIGQINLNISTISRPANLSFGCDKCQKPKIKKQNQQVKPAEVKNAPELEHNLDPNSFKWLFVKYVRGFNDKYHCTNGFVGKYSDKIGAADRLKKMGKAALDRIIKFDEQPTDSYDAIYLCGVSKKGYGSKSNVPYWEKDNYKDNLHVAIKPEPGATDQKVFNGKWNLKITNGKFLPIPGEDELPERYKKFSDDFKKCRMFRWVACFYENLTKDKK